MSFNSDFKYLEVLVISVQHNYVEHRFLEITNSWYTFLCPAYLLFFLFCFLTLSSTNSKIQHRFLELFSFQFMNKKPGSRSNKTIERLNRNLMLVLLKQVGLVTIEPNHRLYSINNLQSVPAI